MGTIYLIACSKQKLENPAPAHKLYTSPLFQLSLAYAQKHRPSPIFVLSAEHGLVNLDEMIEPYDKTLARMSRSARETWAEGVMKELRNRGLVRNKFVILAGEKYYENLLPGLEHYELPLEGLPLGKRLQFLKHG